MKTAVLSTVLLAAVASARPVLEIEAIRRGYKLVKRQFGLGGCKPVTVIFSRGTWEPGTDGMLVGSPFSSALSRALGVGQVDFQGVRYDAGVTGYLIGGDPAGAATMARMVSSTASKCPSTKIVMGGYSQGAQVTHMAAGRLSQADKDRVVAVVMFGDPNKGRPIPGMSRDKIHTVCASSDPICAGIPLPLGSHLTYGSDFSALTGAANFVKQKVGSAPAPKGAAPAAPKGAAPAAPKGAAPKGAAPKSPKKYDAGGAEELSAADVWSQLNESEPAVASEPIVAVPESMAVPAVQVVS